MNHSNKNQNSKKFVCIFESSHSVDSEQKLINHMKKCKSMQKQSYQCCQYNPLHWVKYNTIKEHQQNCIDKDNISNKKDISMLLPLDISNYQFNDVPFQIDTSMVQSSSTGRVNNCFQKGQNYQKQKQQPIMKKKDKIIMQKQRKVEMWKQPNFQEFMKKRGYKQNNQIRANNQNHSFLGNNSSLLF